MSDRHMPSIFSECDKLKQIYDKCFTEFFQKFISPNYRHQYAVNPCDRLQQVYRDCVEEMDPSNFPAPQLGEAAEARFSHLERTLEAFQENARHMGVIASDFSSKSQDVFNQKIHTLTSGLLELDQLKTQYTDVKIPLELLEVLDDGKNPHIYTRDLLERTLQKNKEVNGKIEIYKKFRAHLLKRFAEEMPEDAAKYLNIRAMDDS
ncbi:unnamed protein product [Auanema sp. JU1783]|nr:unnamed protein product [Auanema sp. JU1783]